MRTAADAWRKRGLLWGASALLALLAVGQLAAAPPPKVPADHVAQMTRGRQVFTTHVRSVLMDRCVKCHGGEKTRGGLDLTSRETLLKGGDNGAVVVPHQAKVSRLLQLAAHLDKPHMPPKGEILSPQQLTHLAAWIDLGAPYDRPLLNKSAAKKVMVVTDEDRRFWSFQPLQRSAVPKIKNEAWCRTPIDRFILAKLEEKNLTPNAEADRRKLIRRASFDLIGLPPTPEEVNAFVKDGSPDAYDKLLDHLLASPHFGERWARHWLDLARFAESHGYEQDYDRPNAYHYRDFVIKAFNQDMPYNTFVRWQLAGDEMEPDNPLALMATGFLAAGVHSTQITKNQVEKERYDELDDMARTVGTAMLGLTIGCARCHDHKYDPIPTKDYYRLLSTFTKTVRSDYDIVLDKTKPKPAKIKALICSEGVPALRTHTQGGDFLPNTHFLNRGDPNQKGDIAPQSFLQVLMRAPDGAKHWQVKPPTGWRTSYQRRALAGWITDVEYGAGHLLARVIVNRLWQHHMGRGIVGTPSDFGYQGEKPTHPELLDFLATELIANGWRLKPIHKLIMQSAVYRQSTRFDKERARLDVDNRLYGRRMPQRLEAEIIRDSLLAVSGRLDTHLFGPGTLDANHKRRSIYFFIKRSKLIPTMVLFDGPDSLQGTEQRTTTTIAPQALLLMNNAMVRSCAEELAKRIRPSDSVKLEDALRSGYAIALGRAVDDKELAESLRFVKEQMASYQSERKPEPRHLALTDFCQVLMELNEFIYVD
ncbi:MAG TPA: PSD1 and planctomycete cytochrome C domain-containing protein [Gemmataceae bacterium]|nr:PSD1 and planctomycete cytochrome C domain-containing protein [Gemmataceae bacterium]